MSQMLDKFRKAADKFAVLSCDLTPRQFAKRFKRELRAAGDWFVSVGLAKGEGPKTHDWQPSDDLPHVMNNLIAKDKPNWSSYDRDLMKKYGLEESVPKNAFEHFAVMLCYMHCFSRLEHELTKPFYRPQAA
jgi:hypothetical protein